RSMNCAATAAQLRRVLLLSSTSALSLTYSLPLHAALPIFPPWVADKLAELGGDQPALFDETDGIDFEAVANTTPDVILAAYSGLTQEDYDLLTEIAPTVAYPEAAWATPWREMIE